ncbi:MAG: aldo/keto reductase [Planctomycetes bacterium]|nr:aldo/keto reductase [Planctomycetota bacterium]
MRTRDLGSTGIPLTTVGLGTWAIGGANWRFGWGASDDREAVAALVRGVRAGANWIDTAAVYGFGHAEELVGAALKQIGPGSRPFVATKCSRLPQESGVPRGCLQRDSILRECEASLRRLGVDHIDLYQVHWPDPEADLEEGWDALGTLLQQGKIRFAGVSNFDVAQLDRVQARRPVASLQPPYSMVRRGIEPAVLPWCAAHGVGVVVYSPMQKGLLTGRFDVARARSLPDDDHRSRDPEFQGARLAANLALVDALRGLAQELGATVAQLAIAWTLRRPEVTSAIVGVRRPEQVEELLGASDLALDAAVLGVIDRLLETREARLA